jgi:hypothetical protein
VGAEQPPRALKPARGAPELYSEAVQSSGCALSHLAYVAWRGSGPLAKPQFRLFDFDSTSRDADYLSQVIRSRCHALI